MKKILLMRLSQKVDSLFFYLKFSAKKLYKSLLF